MCTLDYKNEKAYVHQTAANDMAATCRFLTTREVDESAVMNYTRLITGVQSAGYVV